METVSDASLLSGRDAVGAGPAPLPELASEEILRYSRHLMVPEIGMEGQRRLKSARVLIVGAGGLGSPLGLYLAAAGVGHLGILDFDTVELSNLQRQVIHGSSDVGRRKVDSAGDRLRDVNPHARLELVHDRLTARNACEIISDYDVVVDGTDNFPTRYLVNDACVLTGRPNVYGSVFQFDGKVSVFAALNGPCYRCLFREPPPPGLVPSCAEGGVLGVLPGLIGVLQAIEAIKLILGIGEPLVGQLLTVDALRMQFRTIAVQRDPDCPACGTRELRTLVEYEQSCDAAGAASTSVARDDVPEISPAELSGWLSARRDIELIDVREPQEWTIGHIDGARLVPLGTLENAIPSIDASRDVVVYCKGGTRSASAAMQLRAAGLRRVWSLAGGINRWSEDVDPTMPRY